MPRLKTCGFFLVLGFVLIANPAHALLFDFSFVNTVGNVPGTVTGRIFGLQDNMAGQAATSVVINSFPAGLTGVANSGLDAVGWASIPVNTFSVTNGQIVAAAFGYR